MQINLQLIGLADRSINRFFLPPIESQPKIEQDTIMEHRQIAYDLLVIMTGLAYRTGKVRY